jgi:hypothetical protein
MSRFCVFAILLLIAPAVSATYITISVSTLSDGFIAQSPGDVNLTVSNFGDEPAYDVQFSLLLPEGFNATPISVDSIEPNQKVPASFSIHVSDGVPAGEYQADMMVRYSDGNDYKFSMVNPVKLVYRKQAASSIRGSMGNVEIPAGGSGTLALKLSNLGNVSRQVSVKLEVPYEIKVESPERTVTIPPEGSVQIDFPVSSLGALPDSNYLVYAVADYTEGLHYSTVVRGAVHLPGKKGTAEMLPEWISGVPGFVLAISVFVIFVLAVSYLKRRWARPDGSDKKT